MQAVLAPRSRRCFPVPPVAAFPAVITSAASGELGADAIARLTEIERALADRVPAGPVLQAPSRKELERQLFNGFDTATDYYIESGIVVWRAVGHDYQKLLGLSANSGELVEREFFDRADAFSAPTFIKAVAAMRVVRRVGQWLLSAEPGGAYTEMASPRDLLESFMAATFIATLLLAQVRGTVSGARPGNLKALAAHLMDAAADVYRGAVDGGCPQAAHEENPWYWSPDWQEGEVEADLDRRRGRVRRFSSAEHLIGSLKGS